MFSFAQPLEQRIQSFSAHSPTRALYESSKGSPSHVEGKEALSQLDTFREQRQESGVVACSTSELLVRLGRVEEYAKSLFKEFSILESVAFYGAAFEVARDPDGFELALLTEPLDPLLLGSTAFDSTEFNDLALGELVEFLNANPESHREVPFVITLEHSVVSPQSQISKLTEAAHFVVVRGNWRTLALSFANLPDVDTLEIAC